MDQSLSTRFSSFNLFTNATGQSGGAFRTSATPPPAFLALAERAPEARDVVIFWGPGQCREDLLAIANAASEAGLNYRIVEVLDDGFLSGTVKMDLYCNNELGLHTQVIASFAAREGAAGHTHRLSLSQDGQQALPAVDFIAWLRTPPGEPGFPLCTPWQGTVHAFWPFSARLQDDYQALRLSGTSGPIISYACRKGGSVHNAVSAMLDLCAYVGAARGQAPYLEPDYVAARMLGVAGDTVTCLGGRFRRVLVVGAPRTSAQAQHDELMDGLQGRNGRPARMLGDKEDLQAVACAMRHPLVRGAAPKRQARKIENVFMVRAERCKLDAMDELQAAHPALATMTDHAGRSGQQVYRRVASSLAVARETAVLTARQGNAGNLCCLLDNIALLRRHGEPLRLNLASLIHGRPEFQVIALQWAVGQEDSELFLNLLQAVNPAERPAVVEQCYRLALQTSRSVAIDLLSQIFSQASVAQLIAYGIGDGASQGVVRAWLSELDWISGHDSAKVVLEALARRNLFGLLASQERDIAKKFRQLMKVVLEDWQLYSSYAEALLPYAQETRNLAMVEQLAQGYFQADRRDAAQTIQPGQNASRAISADI